MSAPTPRRCASCCWSWPRCRRASINEGEGVRSQKSGVRIGAVLMKYKNTIFAVVLVLAVLYLGDKHGWFRQQPAQAQGPAPYAECEKLRLHNELGAPACYQKLSQSRD